MDSRQVSVAKVDVKRDHMAGRRRWYIQTSISTDIIVSHRNYTIYGKLFSQCLFCFVLFATIFIIIIVVYDFVWTQQRQKMTHLWLWSCTTVRISIETKQMKHEWRIDLCLMPMTMPVSMAYYTAWYAKIKQSHW